MEKKLYTKIFQRCKDYYNLIEYLHLNRHSSRWKVARFDTQPPTPRGDNSGKLTWRMGRDDAIILN